jgi:hypothetical protein
MTYINVLSHHLHEKAVFSQTIKSRRTKQFLHVFCMVEMCSLLLRWKNIQVHEDIEFREM